MKPSEWLSGIEPESVYPVTVLDELERYGIRHEGDGILTSRMQHGYPYPTFGRTSSVTTMSERELVREAGTLGYSLSIERHDDGLQVFGFAIVTAVWRLVCPVTAGRPPSSYESDPSMKAKEDLRAIRSYGY